MNKFLTIIFSAILITSCQEQKQQTLKIEKVAPIFVGTIIKVKGIILKNELIAKEGDSLVEGDLIETKEKSFARLEMNDNTSINLGQKSKILLKDYKIKDLENRVVDVSLVIGKIKTHFRKKLQEGKGSLKVTTPLASFGVRGTEFITESASNGKTKMLLLEGKVILTKKKKNSEEKQEIEIKPMEIVSFEETSEVVTQTITEEVLVQVNNDENMEIEIQKIEDSALLPVEVQVSEPPKSSSVDANIRNFLFNLEHSSKALPLKRNGKIVYFDDHAQNRLVKNKNGQVVAVDIDQDKGIKKYKIPVVSENGRKIYLDISEDYLFSIVKQSNNLGVAIREYNNGEDFSPKRMPASEEKK